MRENLMDLKKEVAEVCEKVDRGYAAELGHQSGPTKYTLTLTDKELAGVLDALVVARAYTTQTLETSRAINQTGTPTYLQEDIKKFNDLISLFNERPAIVQE